MSARLRITRAGPLATIQDAGRFGMLRHGISASGPMDNAAYALAGQLAGGGHGAIEITTAGLDLLVESGHCNLGLAGGLFTARHNDFAIDWPGSVALSAGDSLSITPGPAGNYGYLRFDAGLECPPVLGSLATSTRAAIGGHHGRALVTGDILHLHPAVDGALTNTPTASPSDTGPIRIVWGLHADLFRPAIRQAFLQHPFAIGRRHDRMGIRLDDPQGVFAEATILSLVSDAIVPGDIQILGDGTPTVLMRDHQPTGGYPRIATVISADLDRLAQLRPGAMLSFAAVSADHALSLLRSQIR